MKKITLIAMFIVCGAFGAVTHNDVMRDVFIQKLSEYENCEVVTWLFNSYESGTSFRYYAKVSCSEKQRLPRKIFTLDLLDVSKNLAGKYIYTYGDER